MTPWNTVSILTNMGVNRHRTPVHSWVQKADLQLAGGASPETAGPVTGESIPTDSVSDDTRQAQQAVSRLHLGRHAFV